MLVIWLCEFWSIILVHTEILYCNNYLVPTWVERLLARNYVRKDKGILTVGESDSVELSGELRKYKNSQWGKWEGKSFINITIVFNITMLTSQGVNHVTKVPWKQKGKQCDFITHLYFIWYCILQYFPVNEVFFFFTVTKETLLSKGLIFYWVYLQNVFKWDVFSWETRNFSPWLTGQPHIYRLLPYPSVRLSIWHSWPQSKHLSCGLIPSHSHATRLCVWHLPRLSVWFPAWLARPPGAAGCWVTHPRARGWAVPQL